MNKPSPHLVPDPGHGALDRGKSLFVTAQDGLRLHVREYGTRSAPGMPVVCLPGLARTRRRFRRARAGAGGRSAGAARDRDRFARARPFRSRRRSYQLQLHDRARRHRQRSDSRLASARRCLSEARAAACSPCCSPRRIRSRSPRVVLHDVGPVHEAKGMARIKGYLGKLPHPRTYEEGAEMLRGLMSAQFPKLTAEQWLVRRAADLASQARRAQAGLRSGHRARTRRHRYRSSDAVAVARIRRARRRADAGRSRRQFRLAFGRDGGGDARAARGHGHDRSRRPGPRAAARGRTGAPDCRFVENCEAARRAPAARRPRRSRGDYANVGL